MAALDVFVDTAGFLALWDAGDEHHARALQLQRDLVRTGRRFLTSDYVIDETVTLLLVRHSHSAARDFLRTALASDSLQVHWISPDRFHAAADFFTRHDDKEWSFTDCMSFVFMHELNVRDAFTTDPHFRQAGFLALLEAGRGRRRSRPAG